MASGEWRVASGQRSAVTGPWQVVSGQWSVVSVVVRRSMYLCGLTSAPESAPSLWVALSFHSTCQFHDSMGHRAGEHEGQMGPRAGGSYPSLVRARVRMAAMRLIAIPSVVEHAVR